MPNKLKREFYDDEKTPEAYAEALAKLSIYDPIKKLELEEEERYLDIYCNAFEGLNVFNPYAFLYHGVRFDDDHSLFESILRDKEIRCARKTKQSFKAFGDNCNDGEYVSLMPFVDDEDLEFNVFVKNSVAFVVSPNLNPVKCKFLPYEQWAQVKYKLPMTKHRYSYAKLEYQYPDSFSLDYVVGLLYPLNHNIIQYGLSFARNDFEYIKALLKKYGFQDLHIFDPLDDFRLISGVLSFDTGRK